MIIHPKENAANEFDWLFVSTMKCATNSMYKVLPEIGGQRLWNTQGAFHARPNGRFADRHFTIVRNPYDRAVSIWASTCLREGGDRYNAIGRIRGSGGDPKDFTDFCMFCLDGGPQAWTPHQWLFSNQSDWAKTFIVDDLVHIDNLKEELERIVGPVPSLPVENKSEHDSWLRYMNADTIDLINDWAREDFALGGYKMLEPKDLEEAESA